MVEPASHLLPFLLAVHRAPRAAGTEELTREPGMPSARSVYRWHEEYRGSLVYYPAVQYGAFGLTHLHLLIHEPTGAWASWPYAVRADWIVPQPGANSLYLHCLVPRVHEEQVHELLQLLRERGACEGIVIVASDDGWQQLAPEDLPRASSGRSASDLVKRYPFLLPVLFEHAEQRRSYPELWSTIYARLGEEVWTYLPRGTHRTRHNGRRFVRDAYRLINDAFLFRQHVVRFAQPDTVEVMFRTDSTPAAVLAFARGDAPAVELYPSGTEHLVRMTATMGLLTRLFSTSTLSVFDWVFVDALRTPPAVRFAYELLFNPTTSEWIFPGEEILRRLSR